MKYKESFDAHGMRVLSGLGWQLLCDQNVAQLCRRNANDSMAGHVNCEYFNDEHEKQCAHVDIDILIRFAQTAERECPTIRSL